MNHRISWMALLSVLICLPVHAGGDLAAGKQKSAVCQTCHGVDGNSTNAQFPRLAGQYSDYIVQALSEYKSGARTNPIMAGFAANLSQRDMEDLASYFAGQSGLVVVKK